MDRQFSIHRPWTKEEQQQERERLLRSLPAYSRLILTHDIGGKLADEIPAIKVRNSRSPGRMLIVRQGKRWYVPITWLDCDAMRVKIEMMKHLTT